MIMINTDSSMVVGSGDILPPNVGKSIRALHVQDQYDSSDATGCGLRPEKDDDECVEDPASDSPAAAVPLPATDTAATTRTTVATLEQPHQSNATTTETTTSLSITTSSTTTKLERKNVSFGTIQIRSHAVTIGDNPGCLQGTPISLDWEYHDEKPVNLDLYEFNHCIHLGQQGRRRTLRQLHLDCRQRQDLLAAAGHSATEIQQAQQRVARMRWERQVTRFFLPLAKLEDWVESIVRPNQEAPLIWQQHSS